MCDEWMPVVQLPINLEQFHRLPRNAAYKYEFLRGQAHLSPRPKFYHALLSLDQFNPDESVPDDIRVRLLRDEDMSELERVFAGAFNRQQPFACLDEETQRKAVRQSLEKTRSGGDGPWLREASFVAIDDRDRCVGAIFITLLPDGDPEDWDSFRWLEPPPPDCVAQRLGRPHITWIFVSPWHAGRGTGTVLLTAAIGVLRTLGYQQLASTFMLGNDSSMLWHWRNCFQLMAYPGSRRRMERIWKKRQGVGET